MPVSVMLGWFVRGKSIIKRDTIVLMLVLFICLLIPLFRIGLGNINEIFLLIGRSNTDTKNIVDELYKPVVDSGVVKHYIYFMLYIIFLVVNSDLIINKAYCDKLCQYLNIGFKILFVAIIMEWCFVNLFQGFNDRQLMGYIFSVSKMNQSSNWETWGFYSVALGFTERSEMGISMIYYLLSLKNIRKSVGDILWIVLSACAVICTGSTTALMALLFYIVLEVVFIMIPGREKDKRSVLLLSLVGTCILIFVFMNRTVLLNKVMLFINSESTWGSAYARNQSIRYGIEAIKLYPFLGVGIGTVYAHSMLIQSLANIGVLGVSISLMLHYYLCKFKWSIENCITILVLFGFYFGSSLIQKFTSPLILVIFIVLRYDLSNKKGYGGIYDKDFNYNDNI